MYYRSDIGILLILLSEESGGMRAKVPFPSSPNPVMTLTLSLIGWVIGNVNLFRHSEVFVTSEKRTRLVEAAEWKPSIVKDVFERGVGISLRTNSRWS